MSHHYSGPDFGFPHDDARLDLCDLFAFPKPGDASSSILIMDVHPSVGVNPEGPTSAEPFAPEAIYELRIGTDGDAVADIGYRVRFSPSEDGTQTATVRRVEGAEAGGMGDGGEAIIEGAPVSTGREAQVTQANGYRFFAGWRSDPFFFDVEGAQNDFRFTGTDFFADKDVCGIVLGIPNRDLGADEVGLWHRKLVSADGADWAQVERGARTQQAVFLVPNEEKEAYVGGEPADDARFVDGIAHELEHTGGYAPEEARRVARTMLPDILPYDHTRPVAYADNGRLLIDDVADPFIARSTRGPPAPVVADRRSCRDFPARRCGAQPGRRGRVLQTGTAASLCPTMPPRHCPEVSCAWPALRDASLGRQSPSASPSRGFSSRPASTEPENS